MPSPGFFHDGPLADGLQRSARLWFWAATAVSLVWAVVFSCYSAYLQSVFRGSPDSAIHAQLLWNLGRGRFFETSFLPYSFAGNHFWPALYTVVPLFMATGLTGMLVLQAFLLASGAVAVYALCHHETDSPAWSFLLACAYLSCPTVSAGVLHDFHFELISVPFSLLALLGLRHRKWWFVAPLLLSLGFYEVNGLVWPFVGLGMLFARDRRLRRMGLALFFCSVVYTGVVTGVVMPHFRGIPEPHAWVRYAHLGATPAEAALTLLRHPFRCLSQSVSSQDLGSFRLLLAFGLLPLFGFRRLAPALPLWLLLLLSKWDLAANIRFGYFAPVIPSLVWASCLGVSRLRRRCPSRHVRMTFFFVVAIFVAWTFVFYQVSKPMRRHPFTVRENLDEIRVAVSLVPPEASVSADGHICPVLYRRRHLQVTSDTLWNGNRADFLLVDLSENAYKEPGWAKRIRGVVSPSGYQPVWFQNGIALLRYQGGDPGLTGPFLDYLEQRVRQGTLP